MSGLLCASWPSASISKAVWLTAKAPMLICRLKSEVTQGRRYPPYLELFLTLVPSVALPGFLAASYRCTFHLLISLPAHNNLHRGPDNLLFVNCIVSRRVGSSRINSGGNSLPSHGGSAWLRVVCTRIISSSAFSMYVSGSNRAPLRCSPNRSLYPIGYVVRCSRSAM